MTSPRRPTKRQSPPRPRFVFAGFLPLCHQDGEWWMLLGQEKDEDRLEWGAFGGGPDPGETDASQTAVREATEESHGLLARKALEKSLKGGPLVRTPKAVIYGVVVPSDMDARMNATFATQTGREPIGGCYEKLHASWMPLKALYSVKKHRAVRAIEGRRLRAPMPISTASPTVQETLQRLDHAYDESDWTEETLQRGVSRMDEACRMKRALAGRRRPARAAHRPSARQGRQNV